MSPAPAMGRRAAGEAQLGGAVLMHRKRLGRGRPSWRQAGKDRRGAGAGDALPACPRGRGESRRTGSPGGGGGDGAPRRIDCRLHTPNGRQVSALHGRQRHKRGQICPRLPPLPLRRHKPAGASAWAKARASGPTASTGTAGCAGRFRRCVPRRPRAPCPGGGAIRDYTADRFNHQVLGSGRRLPRACRPEYCSAYSGHPSTARWAPSAQG